MVMSAWLNFDTHGSERAEGILTPTYGCQQFELLIVVNLEGLVSGLI
jgi:hypothetical protein